MFRRKRYAAQASDIPWWPSEVPADPRNPDPDHAGYGYPGPQGDLPPLAAHDPFGGWPAFAGNGDGIDGASGQPHPSTGWPLTASYAESEEAFADPAEASVPEPDFTHEFPPAEPAFSPGAADGYTAAPSDHGDEELPDWLPLLTHPVGGQRFRPDAESTPAERLPEPPRNGRRRGNRRPADPGEILAAGPNPPPVPNPATVPDPAEASALAGAFAADYLSWDQDDPDRRGSVLAQYLPTDITGDASLLGWSGKGRQRSDFALPGAVQPDGDGRVLVDVRVRVTPFRQVGQTGVNSAPKPGELEVAGVAAVAPAPTARGWKSLDSYWVRLTVPVTRDRGRLVVDTWDEQLTGEPADECTGPSVDPTTAEDSYEEGP